MCPLPTLSRMFAPRILIPALRQAPAPLSVILRQKHEGASRRTPSCQALSGPLRPLFVAILFVSGRSNWVDSRVKAHPPPRPRSVRGAGRLVRGAPSRNCARTLPARASPPRAAHSAYTSSALHHANPSSGSRNNSSSLSSSRMRNSHRSSMKWSSLRLRSRI